MKVSSRERFAAVVWIGALSALVLQCAALRAQDIEIVKAGNVKTRIDLGALSATGHAALLFKQTLDADLVRSGWFKTDGTGSGNIAFVGTVRASGEVAVNAELLNRVSGKRYFSRSYREASTQAVRLAHRVADEILWAIKGIKGIASSRIVMIGQRKGLKDVYVCDADGGNLVRVTREGAVCLSPQWGDDGESVLYTSYHAGFPDVYRLDLKANRRRRIAGYPGLNAGATLSPDGRHIALTLSKDGNPDLYLIETRSGSLTRLTRTRHAAEASPSWSPDGKHVVYVSDSSKRPQLYVVGREGGHPRMISFQGTENVSPDWGPDGRIAYSSRRGGRYQICLINPHTREKTQLTTEYVDHEGPAWAPDGRHIVYSRTQEYSSTLYVLDTLGDAPVRLIKTPGNWYSPDWSPE